jgi:hypothetical protein
MICAVAFTRLQKCDALHARRLLLVQVDMRR